MTPQQRMERQLAIAEAITSTARVLGEHALNLPRKGKKRNIFIKSYNRRPNSKKKSAVIVTKMIANIYFGALDVLRIQQTPIPKFKNGTPVIQDHGKPEIIL
jgi:hypothetical protein